MLAVFSRLDRSIEEMARDQGATPWQILRHVIVPIVLPGLIAVALFGRMGNPRRRHLLHPVFARIGEQNLLHLAVDEVLVAKPCRLGLVLLFLERRFIEQVGERRIKNRR